MLTGQLLELIYEAASIQRWNDHIRPAQGFTELDKQAHKMVYAYVLGKFEEAGGTLQFDWTKLIEGGLFEFLHRIKLTDIKPPVFHKIMEEKGHEINRWVLGPVSYTHLMILLMLGMWQKAIFLQLKMGSQGRNISCPVNGFPLMT